MMRYTAGIISSLDKIFGGVLIGALETNNEDKDKIINSTRVNRNRFIGTFTSNVFQDEYAIFYDIISNLNIYVFTLDELNDIVDNNRDLILDSPYVDLTAFEVTVRDTQTTDDEKIEAFKISLKDKLKELSNKYIDEETFISACSLYIDAYKNNYMLEVSQSMARIMSSEGYSEKQPGKRIESYKGADDCMRYYATKMQILKELVDPHKNKSIVLDEEWVKSELQRDDGEVDKEALMYIGIPEIDKAFGELRRGNMLGILGPPKGGKTKISNYIVGIALELGYNVCVWTLEGSKEEWTSMQLALLIRRKKGIVVDSRTILQRKYSNDKNLKALVDWATLELGANPERGKLSFIDSIAYVEDFLDDLETHYNYENPFDLLVIDQLIDIDSRRGMGKVERISTAYQKLKLYIQTQMKRSAVAVIPAQLKQAQVDMKIKNPDEPMEITAGGESAETARTPDFIFGIFSTKDEKSAGIAHIYSVGSRQSEDFQDFRLRSDLSCCYFESDPTLNS